VNISIWQRVRKGEGKVSPLNFHPDQCDPNLFSELRRLRAKFEHKANELNLRVVAITSSVSGEGKTLSGAGLATNLATDGRKKVLLLDMDLRNSELAKGLGIPAAPGLSDYLLGAVSLDEVIRNIMFNELYVISSGSIIEDPSDLLNGNRFKDLIIELRKRYDFVIIDTPPVIPVSDALNIRNIVDGFIFIIRSDFTPFGMIKQAIGEIGEDRIIGVVINGVESEKNRYYKRYYGKYYHKPQDNNRK
jgi:capsular exopolysaccharide synthesis family protein